MNRFLSLLIIVAAIFFAAAPRAHAAAASSESFSWDNTVIQIEVTSKSYNYIQPWQRNEHKTYKSGVVVEGHQIITTAEGLADQTLIRLKKQGAGLYSLGSIAWIDYQANLAAITTDEKDFWTGLQPAKLADPVPINGPVRILRWRDGSIESRQGEVERLTVDNSALSFVSVPALKIDASVPGVGYGEAVVVGDKLVGIASGQGGDAVTAIPSFFIASVLKAQQAKTYTGLGYFDFTWDPVENPLNLQALKVTGPARGVIIKEIGLKPGVTSVVKPHDVLVSIDGFDIDAEGNYHDPQYKKLSLENLSSRGKWAGATCKFKVWRDGKEMDINYDLPKADYADELVPTQSFDQAPEYVLAGGFVFTPLSDSYLRSWGPNWRSRSPFRLYYYNFDKVKPDRPERVVLTMVLPHRSNIGYERLRNIVLDEVNGVKIKRIEDLVTALKSPIDGFDVFKFEDGQGVRKAVLDASTIDEVNDQIMQRYYIPADHYLNSGTPTASTAPAAAPGTPASAHE